jgi:hypothetical protein
MVDIRIRDRGPAVAALQVLVNGYLRATRLVVDGIYGPDTESAVAEVKARAGARGGGDQVLAPTWAALTSVTRVSVISANDIYDPRHDEVTPPELRGPGWIANSGMSGGVGQIVDDISTRVQALGPIALLRLYGHGAPGLMGVTGGTGTMRGPLGGTIYRDSEGRELEDSLRPDRRWGSPVRGDHVRDQTTISSESWVLIEPTLTRLRGLFAPFGSIELHGCRVGLGHEGQRLLGSLAETVRVPASAGLRSQTFGLTTSLRFEGPVRTVYPGDDDLAAWSSRLRFQ